MLVKSSQEEKLYRHRIDGCKMWKLDRKYIHNIFSSVVGYSRLQARQKQTRFHRKKKQPKR